MKAGINLILLEARVGQNICLASWAQTLLGIRLQGALSVPSGPQLFLDTRQDYLLPEKPHSWWVAELSSSAHLPALNLETTNTWHLNSKRTLEFTYCWHNHHIIHIVPFRKVLEEINRDLYFKNKTRFLKSIRLIMVQLFLIPCTKHPYVPFTVPTSIWTPWSEIQKSFPSTFWTQYFEMGWSLGF